MCGTPRDTHFLRGVGHVHGLSMVGNCTFAKYSYAGAITGPEDAG